MQFSCHVWKKLPHIRELGCPPLTAFLAHLLQCFWNLRCKDYVVDASVLASHPKVGCSVCFDQLWLSIRVFLRKKSFLDEE